MPKLDNHPISLAIVGGGEAARKTISALQGFPKIAINSVVCEEEELSGCIADEQRVSSLHSALTRPDIQAVYVATPNTTLIPIALQALLAGKHVLIEKPLAASLDETDLLRAYTAERPIIGVAFKKRFGDWLACFKPRLIDDGCYDVTVTWHIQPPGTSWRYEAAISGGGVIPDLGSHLFDLLENILGEIVRLRARATYGEKGKSVDTSANIALEFANGSRARVTIGWTGQARDLGLTMSCKEHTVSYSRGALGKDLVSFSSPGVERAWEFDPGSEYRGLFTQLQLAILGEPHALPTCEDGKRNLSIIDAAYLSSKTGASVSCLRE